MFKIIEINGVKQLANVSGEKPKLEPQHAEINEMLMHGIVSEEAISEWVLVLSDLKSETTVEPSSLLNMLTLH